MKFIHCGDLHLDSALGAYPADKARKRREEILSTFERLCDYASENGVTAVIIAGDMFDTGRITAKTRARVLGAIKRHNNLDFLYLSGNHDEVNFFTGEQEIPNNFKQFGDEWTAFTYDNVVITGVCVNKANVSTVYDTLNLEENKLNIVVMHGQVVTYSVNDNASLISLPLLKDRNIDYLALGHIHSHSVAKLDLRGEYAYCGCLEGRGFDEVGKKGFILLETNGGKLSNCFVPMASRSLGVFELDVSRYNSWYDFVQEALAIVTQNAGSDDLIEVVLKGEHGTDFEIDIEYLYSRLERLFFFVKINDKTELKVNEKDFELDKSVRGEFVRAVWQSDLDEELKAKVIMCGIKALKGEQF